jgi:hypothetical protein
MLIRFVTVGCLACLVALASCFPASAGEAAGRKQVFNGKNLDGWKVVGCEAVVKDGVILMKDGNGLVVLDGRHGDFTLELKWRALRDAKWDSGIYFRCELPPEGGRPWPPRYQVNLRQGMEGNISDLATAKSEGLAKAGEWNEMKLTVVGTTAKLEFNGKPAWEADGLQQPEGIIALQAEVPGGGQFEFKDIYLTERTP